jgi:hypothetical protein
MRRDRIVSLRNPWFTASVGVTAPVAIATVVVRFAWLPAERPGEQPHGLWYAICTAAGLVSTYGAQPCPDRDDGDDKRPLPVSC